MTARRKTPSTLVKKAVAAMSRGGLTLSRSQLQELRLAFSNLNEEDLAKLAPEPVEGESVLAFIKRELRSANGTAKVYLGYLRDVLEEHNVALPKAAAASLSAMCDYASTKMTEKGLRKTVEEALSRYRSDYDTSYRIRTG